MYPENEIFREGLDELASHYHHILQLLGEDPTREGLLKTPMRVAKAMQVLTRGYEMDAHKVLTDALFREDYSQMVIVKDIDFFSLCEHHMLPFYGKAHVAYIPNGYITGLSKIARVVDIYSHRLAGAGAPDAANQGVHRADTQAPWRNGGDRGSPHVHADARCGETEQHHYYQRLQWSLQSGQDPTGVYESPTQRPQ